MDIIDVILGRALSSQGQISTYAAMAQQAVTRAEEAVSSASTIVNQASDILEDANDALTAAESASTTATTVAADLEQLKTDIATAATSIVDQHITNLLQVTNINVAENTAAIQSLQYHLQYLHNLIPLVSIYNEGSDTPTTGITTNIIGNRLTISSTGVNADTAIEFGDVDTTTLKDGHTYRYIMHIISGNNAADDISISVTNNGTAIHTNPDSLSNGDKRVDFTYTNGQEPVFNYVVTANQTFTNDIVEFYLFDLTENEYDSIMGEDGIQQSVKDYIAAIKAELEAEIEAGGGGGGTINLGVDNAGRIVVVGINGYPIAAAISESDVIEALIKSGSYHLENTVGLEIDCESKVFTPTQTNASGEDIFRTLPMFGGRRRCNVNDNGLITAFYGESGYREDGSNGQVMVYQPQFYYNRIITKTSVLSNGKVSRKETIVIAPTKLSSNFKLHPLFINELNQEVEYVLLPAYEGSIYNTSSSSYDTDATTEINLSTDKLSSIAGVKPVTGYEHSNFNMIAAERLASNRGAGWHITNLAFESAQQMLMSTEYSQLNIQEMLGQGIVDLPTGMTTNKACITGSTSSLGNTSGEANSTIGTIDGTQYTYTESGKRAISYRGVENPWGNTWRYVGGVLIHGVGQNNGGNLYICTDFDYSLDYTASNYHSLQCALPAGYSWVSAFFAIDDDYDWIYIPGEFSSSANSALPIGDVLWSPNQLRGLNSLQAGADWDSKLEAGAYSYAADRDASTSWNNINARIMFIPFKNSTYTANIAKWNALEV